MPFACFDISNLTLLIEATLELMVVDVIFLPVTFLLFLYPATHNYTPLDIVNDSVLDLNAFKSTSEEKTVDLQ